MSAMQRRAQPTKQPLLAALDAADEAIHGDGPPEERVARALIVLADGLAAMLAESDRRSLTLRRGTGARQVLDRFRNSQTKEIAKIRLLATEACASPRMDLSGISGRARKATRTTVRDEVRKRRVRRGDRSDTPGGEG